MKREGVSLPDMARLVRANILSCDVLASTGPLRVLSARFDQGGVRSNNGIPALPLAKIASGFRVDAVAMIG
ncbi:hypothetical protein ASF29_13235 [Rhizobium sp. Leaf262]|nr:hypothetical protein ASF29_13235 [Rhizobium sp. Leaf262]